MPQVYIPEALFEQIKNVLPETASPDDFIVKAVRDQLSLEERKAEFCRLSGAVRAAMVENGLSEEQVLADFESYGRRT